MTPATTFREAPLVVDADADAAAPWALTTLAVEATLLEVRTMVADVGDEADDVEAEEEEEPGVEVETLLEEVDDAVLDMPLAREDEVVEGETAAVIAAAPL